MKFKRHEHLFIAVLVLFGAALGCTPGFTPVAGTSTPIPGGTGTFESFPANPSLSAGNVAFVGTGSDGQQGVYSMVAITGSPIRVADLNTPIPDGTGNFTGFIPGNPVIPSDPCISGDNVAFWAKGADNQEGIYLYPTDPFLPVAKVVDRNTAIPEGTGNFASLVPPNPIAPASPAMSGDAVVFRGFGSSGQQGVYRMANGPPIKIADLNTLVPGGVSNFADFSGSPFISGDYISFIGLGGGGPEGMQGVYLLGVDGLSTVADLTTPIPGGTHNFIGFIPGNPVIPPASPSNSQSNVAFIGFGLDGQQGVYSMINGSLASVADLNTPIPGGTGNFTGFVPGNPVVPADPSISGDTVAFVGFGSGGQKGIYLNSAFFFKVAAVGDTLDGKTVSDLRFGRSGLGDAHSISFGADFTDGSQGVYKASF